MNVVRMILADGVIVEPLDPTLPVPPDHEAPQTDAQALAVPAWGSGWPNCQGGRQVRVTAGGVSVNVRAEIAPLVAYALDATRNTGYVLKQEQTGAYVCRPIGGTRIASNHSWGLAVDLNWQENPFTTNPNAPRTITPAVVAIWKSVGFSWGGDWAGKKDFMHMEFNGSPADAARRAAGLNPVRTIEGIDVSHYQGLFDWQAAKDAGIRFAWFKASGSGTDPLFVDPTASRNRAETRRVGIHAGPYHFYLGGQVSPAEQARHFRRCAGPSAPGDLRAALDLEDPPNGRIVLSREDCRELVRETAAQFGHMPAIYVGEELFTRFPWLEAELAGCPLWIPHWSRKPTRKHAVHQYTNARPIPGRDPVDGNRAESLAEVLLGAPSEEDPLSEASDRIEKALAGLVDRVDRIERRLLRQIVDEEGTVYLYDGTTRMWVQDEPWRAALAGAFRFGPPEQWAGADIEKIPLVGPPPTPVS